MQGVLIFKKNYLPAIEKSEFSDDLKSYKNESVGFVCYPLARGNNTETLKTKQ